MNIDEWREMEKLVAKAVEISKDLDRAEDFHHPSSIWFVNGFSGGIKTIIKLTHQQKKLIQDALIADFNTELDNLQTQIHNWTRRE